MSDESGQPKFTFERFHPSKRSVPVSTKGGTHPVWSRDGKELFYREGTKMMAVAVGVAGGERHLSAPRVLFDRDYPYGNSISAAHFDVSADGQRFVLIAEEPGSRHLNVVINWTNEPNARISK